MISGWLPARKEAKLGLAAADSNFLSDKCPRLLRGPAAS